MRPQGRLLRIAKALSVGLPVLVGLGTALFAVAEYSKGQAWKRAEFVAAQVKEFEARAEVRAVMTMLDWNGTDVTLFPERGDSAGKAWVDDDQLSRALAPHTEQPTFSATEQRIRQDFDVFFDGLERFSHFVRADLVTVDDLEPYLDYWVTILGDTTSGRKPVALVKTAWRYLACYRYTGVQRLLRDFGYETAADGQPCP